MAEPAKKPKKTAPAETGAKEEAGESAATWTATPEAKQKALRFRIIAIVLWVVAIGLQAYGIFGLLLNPGILTTTTSIDANGVLTTTPDAFPTWAFVVLIVLLVVIGVLTVIGSQLWKRAQAIDPPSRKNPVAFFLKSQLGAIIPLIAFLPIIILILTNKNMTAQQKGWAGGVGAVVAIAAIALGINYQPPSVEQYTADRQAVIQLLGEDRVYWSQGGSVYHVCGTVSDLANSTVVSGTTAEAVAAGKPRLTLKIESELQACGRAVPTNIDEIVDAIRAVQDGSSTEQVLPAPDWTGVANAPSGVELDQLQEAIEQAGSAG